VILLLGLIIVILLPGGALALDARPASPAAVFAPSDPDLLRFPIEAAPAAGKRARGDVRLKSPAASLAWAALPTLAAMAAGAAAGAAARGEGVAGAAGGIVFLGAAISGPAAGHYYSGEWEHYSYTSMARLVLGVAGGLCLAAGYEPSPQSCVFGGRCYRESTAYAAAGWAAVGLLFGLALYDIIDSPAAAQRANLKALTRPEQDTALIPPPRLPDVPSGAL
jgi:hypothetical protein